MHQVNELINDLSYLYNQQETLKESADVSDKIKEIEVYRNCTRTSAQRIIWNTILSNRASSTPHHHSPAS